MRCHLYCFFFKQKTAYEMRISDWSSDVCSSDLREVTMTVNYGPGSNTDVASRIFAEGMAQELGKTVIVENRAGALGTLAVSWLAKQTPDAHRLGVVTFATQAISPHLMNVSYTMDDFDWVCGFGRYRYGVAVRADSPYKTVDDLVAASKKGESVFFGGTSTPNVIALLELGDRKSVV